MTQTEGWLPPMVLSLIELGFTSLSESVVKRSYGLVYIREWSCRCGCARVMLPDYRPTRFTPRERDALRRMLECRCDVVLQ